MYFGKNSAAEEMCVYKWIKKSLRLWPWKATWIITIKNSLRKLRRTSCFKGKNRAGELKELWLEKQEETKAGSWKDQESDKRLHRSVRKKWKRTRYKPCEPKCDNISTNLTEMDNCKRIFCIVYTVYRLLGSRSISCEKNNTLLY